MRIERPFEIDVPNDAVNEQVVIGAAIADATTRTSLLRRLKPEHFYADAHKAIWRALTQVEERGLAYDPAVVARLERDIDIRYLETIAASRPELPPNLEHHIETLEWDATRANATRGPIAALLDAVQDPLEKPERVKALAAEVGTSFAHVEGAKRRLVFRFADEIAKPREPTPLVFPQFGIGAGRPTMISSYAGVGKTMLKIDMLVSVAADLETAWGGALSVAKHGAVRLIDYEMGDPLLDDRFQRVAHARKVSLAKLRRKLGTASMPTLYLSSDPAEVEAELVDACTGVVLCGIDNFAAATPHAPKGLNDASARLYLDVLTRVSLKTGCAFIVLTHDGKDGNGKRGLQRMRNSSAIADAAGNVLSITVNDGVLRIEQTKASLAKKGDTVRVSFVDVGEEYFDKSMACFRKPGLAIRSEGDDATEQGEDEGPSDAVVQRAKKSLIDFLKSAGQCGPTELVRKAKGRKEAKLQALKELRENGRVISAGDGSKLVKLAVSDDDVDDEPVESDDQKLERLRAEKRKLDSDQEADRAF